MAEEGVAPRLTVVVPTRDRPGSLGACLGALAAASTARPFEIVVVDDGSADPAEVARIVDAFPAARVVRRPAGGIAAARNTGVASAATEFICFTDDDCEPDPDWPTALERRLREGSDVVVGVTVNGRVGDSLAAASQLVSNWLAESDCVEWLGPGSSFASRRSVVLELPFDEGYLAGMAGEDRDWYARVSAAGRTISFAPDAVARHRPAFTLARFWRKHIGYGRGAYRFRRAHRSGRLEQPGFYVRLIGAGFRNGVRIGLAVCLAQLATAVGFAAEALARRA